MARPGRGLASWQRAGAAAGRELLAAAFFVALALLALRPVSGDLTRLTLASGDPLVDLWTVHWLYSHFFDPSQVFHGNTFHPAPHAVLYSDLSLGTVVLLLPLRPFVREPLLVYNLALVAALAFGGWAFHALARGLGAGRWGGLAAGTLAAFASHQLFHVYHLNLLGIGWLALFALGLHALAHGPRPWPGAVLAGVSASLSAQTSGYYAVSVALLGLVFAAVCWRRLRQGWRAPALVAAAVLAAALTLPYLCAYLEVRAEQGLRRPLGMSAAMSFDPTRDLGSQGYLHGALLGRGGERLFPGLLLPSLAALALLRRRPGSAWLGAAAAVFLALSLGPVLRLGPLELPGPYRLLHAVPPFDGMRHPYTFAAVATFLLAALAGTGWASLRLSSRRFAGPILVALACAETLAPPPQVRKVPPGLPPHYEVLQRLPPGPILEVPPFGVESLIWAARHGRPMLNGQGSAFVPADTLRLARTIRNHWLDRVPRDVDRSKPTALLRERFPVRYVVVPARYGRLGDALDHSHTFRRAGEARDGTRVYEMARPAPGR